MIEYVRKIIEHGIVNIQIEINQGIEISSQKDMYNEFIMELISCSNGLVDITFKNDDLYTNIEAFSDITDLNNLIDYENWIIEMNKKIQSKQRKLYHKIPLANRHRIVLLTKYRLVNQLYVSTVHKSNTNQYLHNPYIYFSYRIKEDLSDYTPIVPMKIYFDDRRNTHIFTDTSFYPDRNELVYDEKYHKFFILLLSRLSFKKLLEKFDKNEEEVFMNLIKELENNNCLYFVKYLM
jgi:hypothetical protein